MKVRNALGYS